MAKHRKTRKEKIRSENRKAYVLATPLEEPIPLQEKKSFSFTFSQDENPTPSTHSPKNLQNAHDYTFVTHDLIKTSFVVGGIVVAELLLFVTMR